MSTLQEDAERFVLVVYVCVRHNFEFRSVIGVHLL